LNSEHFEIALEDSDITISESDIALEDLEIALEDSDIMISESDIALEALEIALEASEIMISKSEIASEKSAKAFYFPVIERQPARRKERDELFKIHHALLVLRYFFVLKIRTPKKPNCRCHQTG